MRRIEDHWMDNAKAYFEVNGIEQPKRIEKPRDLFHIKGIVDRDEEIRYRPQKDKQIRTYFEPYKNETCLTLGFIFRTLGANHEFYRTNLEHTAFLAPAQYILDLTQAVQEELEIPQGTYIVLHWRDGEESCHVERPEFHVGYDYFTGAGAYTWAKVEEVIDVLNKELVHHKARAVYLATDTKRDFLLHKIRSNTRVKMLSDSKFLSSIEDNWIVSLIEQQLAIQSRSFIGSGMSNWSEFVQLCKRWFALGRSPKQQSMFEDLMRSYNKSMLHHDVWTNLDGKEKNSEIEADALEKKVTTPQVECRASDMTYNPDNENKLCHVCNVFKDASQDECVIVSISEDRKDWRFEQRLIGTFSNCRINTVQHRERPEWLDAAPLAIGEANYEFTRTLRDFWRVKIDKRIDLLILDVQQKEWVFLNEAVSSHTLSKHVDQLVFEMHVYPLWQKDKVGNNAESAAKSRMARESLEAVEKEGFGLFAHTRIPKETLVRTLSHWIRKGLLKEQP